MNEAGLSLVEVLVSIFLLSLLISLAYGLVSTLDHLHGDNLLQQHVLLTMQKEIKHWRHHVTDFEIGTVTQKKLLIQNTPVDQEILIKQIDTNLIQGEFRFTWSFGKKTREVTWIVDRFTP